MRYVFVFLSVFALSLVLSVGCSETKAFPCTEQGIRDAIAEGGGPHTFACDGPTTVVTEAEIVIDNDVILDGEGNLIVDGNESHRVFSVSENVTAELREFTVTKGFSVEGGGIFNGGTLTLTNSTVSDNTANGGGGINNGGDLTLTNSTVSDNSANAGGGIFNGGTLTLTNSTVSDNTADAAIGGGNGGGISNSGYLTLTNSTVSDNSAVAGGGIYSATRTVTLTNSTVSGNTAVSFGGGIANGAGTMTLTNTLVDDDCAGLNLVSEGGNLESPGDTCDFRTSRGDLFNVTAEQLNLGPLQDNGGPTMTHALLPGSVAIDAIPEAMCEVDTDQRGEPRPETGGTMCDVGAFELEVAP